MAREIISDETLDEIRLLDPRELEFDGHVESGGMGSVSRYKWHSGDSFILVAKKSLFRGSMAYSYRHNLKREMAILAKLDHENIVRTIGVVETVDDFGLVMEYHPFKSYLSFLRDIWANTRKTAEIERAMVPLKIQIIKEIISAMVYLHDHRPPILHLDLKGDNVLLDSELHAKLCDFGLSQMQTLSTLRSMSTSSARAVVGTPGYIDPQRLRDITCRPTTKSDVYSFGILMWEILTGEISYKDVNNDRGLLALHIESKQLRPDVADVPAIFPNELVSMMTLSWAHEPSDRPSFKELEEDIQSLTTRIPDYKGQVRQSRIQTLTLYRSLIDTPRASSSSLGTQRSQPCSSRLNSSRASIRGIDESERSRSFPTYGSVTLIKNTKIPDDRISAIKVPDDNDDDLASLLRPSEPVSRYVIEKKFMSIRKAFLVIVIFLLITAITAIGLGIWKTQDKESPRCKKLDSPNHGNITCTEESDNINMRCDFFCDKGYDISGKQSIMCTGGKWNDKMPVCNRACEELVSVQHGEVECTNGYFVNSTCTVQCIDNHQIQGNKTIVCGGSGTWSSSEPTCVCPSCYTGDKCEFSIKFADVDATLDDLNVYQVQTVNYGDQKFTCTSGVYAFFKFHGKCQDISTQQSQDCNNDHGYDSASGGAKHAAAQLIRTMIQQKLYVAPCDPQNMPSNC